jgi:hypothetical protein
MRNDVERQNALFYECVEDAIKDDILALGGPKKAAEIFFPDKTVEQGAALLRAWSNPERLERPSPSQYILLKARARDANSFACVQYEEQTLSCKVTWIDPVAEQDQLDREIRDLLQVVLKKQEARERAVARESQLKAAVPR